MVLLADHRLSWIIPSLSSGYLFKRQSLLVCCFSQPVDLVADTHIFARGANGSQFLVYSMTFEATGDLAMILPLPVPPNPRDDAVRFINLERYPDFFADLRRGFPAPLAAKLALAVSAEEPALRVHDVGSFEASFVPQTTDFDRLDQRFRIPEEVWSRLPMYNNSGFAVFKLKGASRRQDIHPMAFEFPRRNPALLYFPTVHIHDGEAHRYADFDHRLYCQASPELKDYLGGWAESYGMASAFMDVDRAEGIIGPDDPCWRRTLRGRRENVDTLIGESGNVPIAI